MTLTTAEMERALRERDAAYEGLFFFAVRTTGVFCRPTCGARKPRPENVEYFPRARDAVRAGYRACKRCRPLDIGAASQATSAGLDPSTVRRRSRRRYGVTRNALARGRRLASAMQRLREGGTIDDAMAASGYASHSGFREAFAKAFGAPPGRAAARGDVVLLDWFESPIGPLLAGATADGVCLLEFAEPARLPAQIAMLARLFDAPVLPGSNAHLRLLGSELATYFAGRLQQFTVPLLYPGTPFQRKVWEALLAIPHGETRSYEQIAIAAGSPRAVRAVGSANGRNRIAIVIPCHRVVNKSGSLGGYGGGLRRKEFLLELERGGTGGGQG